MPRRLKQCSLENTAKSDRGRCYRDIRISGAGDIIHTRYAFIKKPRATGWRDAIVDSGVTLSIATPGGGRGEPLARSPGIRVRD